MTTTPTPAPEVEIDVDVLILNLFAWADPIAGGARPVELRNSCYRAATALRSQAARIKELEAEAAASFREASQLAVALHTSWYRDTAPQWELLPDVPGIISQIDNMTAGMGERIQAAEQQLAVERKRSGVLEAEIDHLRRRLYGSVPSDGMCLTSEEKRAQAKRCPCHGSDDYCRCQNTPDSETRRTRATYEETEDGE